MPMSTPHPLTIHTHGSGYPVLCLHGHPGAGSSMGVFTQHLGQRFWAIAPDLRGYGQSRVTQPFVMADHLTDLEALLDRLQIQRCLVLGWSLGGILAMELALRLPERISGLILVATAAHPRSSHPTISWQDNLLTGVAALINSWQPGNRWNIELFAKRSLFRHLIQQHTRTAYEYIAADAVSAYLNTSQAATRALNQAIRAGYNRVPDLPNIRVPALMLAAEGDRHITALSSEETARKLPNCDWQCYARAAHLFPWEIPQQMLQDIDAWLARHPEVVSPSAPLANPQSS
ncbi:alpha/beta hydrolase [Thermoleptolyngbya oregonensis NK1-22]|uniref:Alpha/beta hydrolase n=2 Tax=Thermoleptolyngbya TaxID=2303528 RepID=A0AA96Y5M2_9CYAN|nr:alpha/beta hydrolase [Thermoleptolyngbya oregonensis NK1-22]